LKLPKSGYKSITVKESIYDIVQQQAKAEHCSITNVVEHIVLEYFGEKK